MSVIAVHIIESPDEEDLLANRQEGHALQEFLRLQDVPTTIHSAISIKGFKNSLAAILSGTATARGSGTSGQTTRSQFSM